MPGGELQIPVSNCVSKMDLMEYQIKFHSGKDKADQGVLMKRQFSVLLDETSTFFDEPPIVSLSRFLLDSLIRAGEQCGKESLKAKSQYSCFTCSEGKKI